MVSERGQNDFSLIGIQSGIESIEVSLQNLMSALFEHKGIPRQSSCSGAHVLEEYE